MMLIESEFGAASGAKLNLAKPRILSTLEAAAGEAGAATLITLRGNEFIKSLGWRRRVESRRSIVDSHPAGAPMRETDY